MHNVALGLWIVIVIAAVPYSLRARHPDTKPLAAFMIFFTVFSVAAFMIFGVVTYVLQMTGNAGLLANPVGAAVFLVLVFGPAFLLGRWQLKKPPRQMPPP